MAIAREYQLLVRGNGPLVPRAGVQGRVEGANIGAALLLLFSLVTLVISSLLAWQLSRGHKGPRELGANKTRKNRGTSDSEFGKGDPRRFHQDD